MALPHHPSAKKFFRDAARRMGFARERREIENFEGKLEDYLQAPGTIDGRAILQLGWLGHLCGVGTVEAYAAGDTASLSRLMDRTCAYKTLQLRLDRALSAGIPETPDNRPQEFEDSLNAALPFALSRWPLAQASAEAFLWLVNKDQRLRSADTRRMANGSTDAFLAHLFADAMDLPSDFKPADMLEDCYRDLLDTWRTKDQARFQRAMAGAVDFHIRRSKYSTDHTHFEFDHLFEQVFAVELLAVLALRQRLNLPAFTAGHSWVDGPWSVIQDLPKVASSDLVGRLEDRFKKDYPAFV